MKKTSAILSVCGLLSIFIAGFSGCNGKPSALGTHFNATVLEVYENRVLVEVANGESEHQSADMLSVSTNIEDADASVPDLHTGDLIRVCYDGVILEAYPGQVNHVYAIELLGESFK